MDTTPAVVTATTPATEGDTDGSPLEKVDAPTGFKIEFDGNEYHCWHDPDDIFEGTPEWVVDLATEIGKPKSLEDHDPYEWDQLASALDRRAGDEDDEDRADALTEAAEAIRDAMHHECDCSEIAYQHFTEYVEECLNGLDPGTGIVFAIYDTRYEGTEPDLAGNTLTWDDIVDKCCGRDGHDGARISYDPGTGTGEIQFSDRGWGRPDELVVITDEHRVALVNTLAEHGDGSTSDYLVREICDLNVTPELVAAVEALAEADMTSGIDDDGMELNQLHAVDLFHALDATGVLTLPPADLTGIARLAGTWDGTLTTLVAVLHAAAA